MYIKHNNIKNKAFKSNFILMKDYNISTRDIIYNDKMYNKGFKLTISPIKRGDSIIYRHKTTNYFENIYTKEYAIKNGFAMKVKSIKNIEYDNDNVLFKKISSKLI